MTEKTPTDPICANCVYWEAIGECHLHPPVMTPHDSALWVFPKVGPDDWCGDFTTAKTYIARLRQDMSEWNKEDMDKWLGDKS